MKMDTIPVGYKAICHQLQLLTLPHYRESYIALKGRGKTIIENGHEIHIYPKSYALNNSTDLLANLEFALKYDGINLEIIKVLFLKLDKTAVIAYIQQQPTGIYSRKIAYLYELLLDTQLDVPDCQRIKYIYLLDPTRYYTSLGTKHSRFAIIDNLLGNNHFCPIVRRTKSLEDYISLDLHDKAKALLQQYDPQLIARACNYLYTKETMSSYQIEQEQPDKSRMTRFIHMLQHASTLSSLSKEKLIALQNIIVDPRFQDTDYRSSQNYVGENIAPYFQKIHYISPKPEDVTELMQGLLSTLNKMITEDVHPVIIAATIAFGFVFIHPFEDGNGRIHRFIIHSILARTNFTPNEIIFPVSSVMLKNRNQYDATLELFSKPLLQKLTDYNIASDGTMLVKQDSKSFYQYIDFTKITEYLFSCIKEAIFNYIEREIRFLMHYDQAKLSIQETLDMPDKQIDLFIKCVMQNNGHLSAQKKQRLFSMLTDEEVIQLTAIVKDIMLKTE